MTRGINARTAATVVAILTSLMTTALHAQSAVVLRYGNTSPWPFDGRDDSRDFHGNGSFPGNFATSSSTAWIGAAGVLGSNPQRSVAPYPSQVVFGPSPHPASCAQRHRSYDAVSGTYVGRDGRRHRC